MSMTKKEKKMKYTEDEYARGRKYYEFYFGRPIPDSFDVNVFTRCYMNAPETGSPKEKAAFRKTEEFFAAKENKLTPSSYTFVSTDKDVDLLRIIREAGDVQFILIEKKNRNTNEVIAHLLIHEKVLNNSAVKNLKIYGLPVDRNWGVNRLGYFPGKSLIGTGYQGHRLYPGDGDVEKIRAEIEAVIKALNPKDTRTTVTVW